MSKHDRCDKCGEKVSMNNDAAFFQSILLENPDVMISQARHLLPIVKKGHVVCAGSPVLYKYLVGYRTAGIFFCEPVKMLQYGAAYREMQRQAEKMAPKQQESAQEEKFHG